MKIGSNFSSSVFAMVLALTILVSPIPIHAQTASERSFPQAKPAIENALKSLEAEMAGRLPVLAGFAKTAEDSLDHYRRGYYQSEVEVQANPSGGCTVRVSTKVTAWYVDPNGAASGYRLLTSNGRIEADLLDQLQDQLVKSPSVTSSNAEVAASVTESASESRTAAGPVVAAPEPTVDPRLSAATRPSLPEHSMRENPVETESSKNAKSLQAEANSLQEILKNTAHPKNLVAVKKSGTPVVSAPSLTAKPEFLAALHDEFELLDFNEDWVHVRISGLSRGWIWRNSVEMPEGIGDTEVRPANIATPTTNLYHVVRDERATFPGDWPALRNKKVMILSVQRLDGGKAGGARERLEYAKVLLEQTSDEIAQKQEDLEGVVIVFDSADGGMLAVTSSTLNQWVSGKLSEAALWHDCFFDPPETLDSPESAGSR